MTGEYSWSEELVAVGLTPQQEIRARALDAAMNWIGDPATTVDDAIGLARRYAEWIEHGDSTEGKGE